ncbi:hypothetical protein [Nocardia farcinica]|uniref:hypothetical protein n=1 Tax=Nocardia farcinica TaxID=37329 RepID=UPI000BF91012|nr:hypothetical protein [Nocardia farcinica]PFX02429.1 hypothetical protein CJ469_02876 [Nocardia farcinica]PFX09244.1 hypothetical protein CJ468_01878 [Nocardia farcinica]
MGVVSEDDAKDRGTDRPGSQFGSPVGDFGPPVGDFGPPVGDFGPPVSDFGPPVGEPPTADFGPPVAEFTGPPLAETGPRWQPAGEQPEIGWRPADQPPPPATAPGGRFRAPESGPAPETSAPTRPPAGAERPGRSESEPDVSTEETVRHSAPVPEATPQRWWNSPTESGEVPKPPAEPAGLSWADDPIAQRLAPGTPAAGPKKSGGDNRRILLGVAAAVVVLIGLVVTIVSVSGGDDGTGRAAGPTTTAALSCPATKDGKVAVGNGQGSTASGPDAILGFQYAFYVERSGERVRRFVAPDAENISTAAIIQQAIDEQIPVGTTHCLRITEVAADTFEVDLTEHRPDGTTTVYPQTVTTVNRDGKTLVFAIRERL